MITPLLAFLVTPIVNASCWTLRTRPDAIYARHDHHGYICYGHAIVGRYVCYSTAFFSTDEVVGELVVYEAGSSTLYLNVAVVADAVWDNRIRYEKIPVACRPWTFKVCADALKTKFGR